MTLSFTLEDGLFVAEFEATSRFNLHLERPASGSIYMKQKTVKDGSYVIVKDFGWNRDGDLIIDADCGQGAVYPKWIRLESAVEPSVAEVTFESESSGGGAGTESTMEYLDISGYDDKFMFADILTFATLVRVNLPPINIIGGFGLSIVESNIAEALPKVQFMAIDLTLPVIYGGTFYNSIYDYLISSNSSITEEELAAIPRITKEQFYNLEA